MQRSRSKTFRAVLESTGTSLHWVIARIPLDLKKSWPECRNRRVSGEINGFAFRTTLFPGPKGSGLTLLVNKRMQAGAKARPGDTVRIRVEPDLELRAFIQPEELHKILRGDRRLQRWFERLRPSQQKGIGQLVDQAKSKQTREMRADAGDGRRDGTAAHSARSLCAPAPGAGGMATHDRHPAAESPVRYLLSADGAGTGTPGGWRG